MQPVTKYISVLPEVKGTHTPVILSTKTLLDMFHDSNA